MTSPAPDRVAAYLAEVRQRAESATPGPWWSDQDGLMYRLHGVAFKVPAQLDGIIPEQVMNKQIAKAPKSGTPYAEYWPDAADDAFITSARTDVPRLLAAVEAVLAEHQPGRIVIRGSLCERHEAHGHFSITSAEAADVESCPDCVATARVSCAGCGPAVRLDSCPNRAAITRALLGEEAGNDRDNR